MRRRSKSCGGRGIYDSWRSFAVIDCAFAARAKICGGRRSFAAMPGLRCLRLQTAKNGSLKSRPAGKSCVARGAVALKRRRKKRTERISVLFFKRPPGLPQGKPGGRAPRATLDFPVGLILSAAFTGFCEHLIFQKRSAAFPTFSALLLKTRPVFFKKAALHYKSAKKQPLDRRSLDRSGCPFIFLK